MTKDMTQIAVWKPLFDGIVARTLAAKVKSDGYDADPVTVERLSQYWAQSPAELSVGPEVADAMRDDGEDPQAADQSLAAIPEDSLESYTALVAARLAETLHQTGDLSRMEQQGQVTVLLADSAEGSKILASLVKTSLFPSEVKVLTSWTSRPGSRGIHLVGVYREQGEKFDTTLKSCLSQLEQGLRHRVPLVLVTHDLTLLPRDVRSILPKAIPLAPLSQEGILAALSHTHSRTGRLSTKEVRGLLPPDGRLRRLSTLELIVAFRETSTFRVARKLAEIAGAATQKPNLDALAGTGRLFDLAQQIVSDLEAYAAGEISWSDVPRGLLMTGAPGTGKTFAAKVIADACGLPFIPVTFGQWQSKGHLGDMLGAMRDSFDEARRLAPCVLMIDELDSVGDRTEKSNSNKAYHRQVVNEFLAQLDGVAGCEGVMLIGATNHRENIDAAVLRAGRIDLHVTVPRPNATGIESILRHHLREEGFPDLVPIIRAAAGRTPAEIAAAVRQARADARRAKRCLLPDNIVSALQRGDEMDPDLRWRISVHEAGHAVAAHHFGIGRVESIALRDGGGLIMLVRHKIQGTASDFENELAYHLAGRAAEAVVVGSVSAGSGGSETSDLANATRLALHIERSTGLGRNGLFWESNATPVAPSSLERRSVTARLAAAEGRVEMLLEENRRLLVKLAKALFEAGYLEGDEVQRILNEDSEAGPERGPKMSMRQKTTIPDATNASTPEMGL